MKTSFRARKTRVRRASKCFLGYTTVIAMGDGFEAAIFAATKPRLLEACQRFAPTIEIDPKRFQRVAYFLAKHLEARAAK